VTVTVPVTPYPLLAEVATCLCEELGKYAPTCYCGLLQGGTEVAWDYCAACEGEDCGSAYVTVVAVEPYTSFGIADTMAQCETFYQAIVLVGVLRCLPVHEDGEPPTQEEMADSMLLTQQDMMAMLTAIRCCVPASTKIRGYTPLGPQGGCVGGQWQIVLDLEG
jgi:hypothetical protein